MCCCVVLMGRGPLGAPLLYPPTAAGRKVWRCLSMTHRGCSSLSVKRLTSPVRKSRSGWQLFSTAQDSLVTILLSLTSSTVSRGNPNTELPSSPAHSVAFNGHDSENIRLKTTEELHSLIGGLLISDYMAHLLAVSKCLILHFLCSLCTKFLSVRHFCFTADSCSPWLVTEFQVSLTLLTMDAKKRRFWTLYTVKARRNQIKLLFSVTAS